MDDRFSDAAIVAAGAIIAVHVLWDIASPYMAAGLATAVIIALARGSSPVVRGLFNNPIAVLIGTVSYSIYLLHVLVLGYVQAQVASPLAVFALGAGASIALASVSYILIERPAMALGAFAGNALRRQNARAA